MIKNLPKLLFYCFLLAWNSIIAQETGFDKVGTTSFQFLKVIPNARVAAMGDASTSLVMGSDAVFFNPAIFDSHRKFGFTSSQLNWFQDTKVSSISMSWNQNIYGIFSMHILSVNIGKIEETRVDHLFRDEDGTYNPGITGNSFNPSSVSYGISYLRELTDKFTFGFGVKNATEDLIYEKQSVIIYDAGLLYNTGFKTLKIGTTLNNFGREIIFIDKSYPLPQSLRIGFSGSFWGIKDGIIGTSNHHGLLFSADLSQTRDHSQQQHLGLEYTFREMIYLRFGRKSNFDMEKFTFGFGVVFKNISVNYAMNDFGNDLGNVSRISIGIIK